MNHDTAAAGATFLTLALLAALAVTLYLAITGLICYLIVKALRAVPAEHRKIEPTQVWFLMVPCVGIVWNFFVFQRVPESFRSYFGAVGRTDLGDCGKNLGLWFAITAAGSLIPWIGALFALPALVLLILCLIRFNDLKRQVELGGPAPHATVPPPAAPPAPPQA